MTDFMAWRAYILARLVKMADFAQNGHFWTFLAILASFGLKQASFRPVFTENHEKSLKITDFDTPG